MLLESFKFEPVEHCGCNSTSKIFRILSVDTQENINLVMKTSQHTYDASHSSSFFSPSSSHREELPQHQNIQESQSTLSSKQSIKNNTPSSASKGKKNGTCVSRKGKKSKSEGMISEEVESNCNFHCFMIHKEWQLLEGILPHPNIVQVYKAFQNVDCFYSEAMTNPQQKKNMQTASQSTAAQTQQSHSQSEMSADQLRESDSCCALLMEEAEMDLFDYIEKSYSEQKGKLVSNVIDMFRQIAQGLDHIHSFNYSHNDIKSENVLVFNHLRHAKITDFGLANDLAQYQGLTRLEIAKKQVQQWEYRCLNHAAPEILTTLKTKTSCFDEQKADVFAFGVSFFESIFGFRPFAQFALPSDSIYKHFANKQSFSRYWKTNAQIQSVLRQINNGDIDIDRLFDVLYNTLNKNPHQRISSAELLIHPLFD